MRGLEPPTPGTTIQCSNQLSYIHRGQPVSLVAPPKLVNERIIRHGSAPGCDRAVPSGRKRSKGCRPWLVTVGQIHGGENCNVIPEEVVLRGTIRSLDQGVRAKTIDHIRRLAAGIAGTSDTRIQVRYGAGNPSVVNDSALIQVLRRAGREVLGDRGLDTIRRPSMGSEDFAFYLEHVPGAMLRLGSTSAEIGGSALHTPMFDIDEQALRIGARLLARAAVFWCDPQYHPTPAHPLESAQGDAATPDSYLERA